MGDVPAYDQNLKDALQFGARKDPTKEGAPELGIGMEERNRTHIDVSSAEDAFAAKYWAGGPKRYNRGLNQPGRGPQWNAWFDDFMKRWSEAHPGAHPADPSSYKPKAITVPTSTPTTTAQSTTNTMNMLQVTPQTYASQVQAASARYAQGQQAADNQAMAMVQDSNPRNPKPQSNIDFDRLGNVQTEDDLRHWLSNNFLSPAGQDPLPRDKTSEDYGARQFAPHPDYPEGSGAFTETQSPLPEHDDIWTDMERKMREQTQIRNNLLEQLGAQNLNIPMGQSPEDFLRDDAIRDGGGGRGIEEPKYNWQRKREEMQRGTQNPDRRFPWQEAGLMGDSMQTAEIPWQEMLLGGGAGAYINRMRKKFGSPKGKPGPVVMEKGVPRPVGYGGPISVSGGDAPVPEFTPEQIAQQRRHEENIKRKSIIKPIDYRAELEKAFGPASKSRPSMTPEQRMEMYKLMESMFKEAESLRGNIKGITNEPPPDWDPEAEKRKKIMREGMGGEEARKKARAEQPDLKISGTQADTGKPPTMAPPEVIGEKRILNTPATGYDMARLEDLRKELGFNSNEDIRTAAKKQMELRNLPHNYEGSVTIKSKDGKRTFQIQVGKDSADRYRTILSAQEVKPRGGTRRGFVRTPDVKAIRQAINANPGAVKGGALASLAMLLGSHKDNAWDWSDAINKEAWEGADLGGAFGGAASAMVGGIENYNLDTLLGGVNPYLPKHLAGGVKDVAQVLIGDPFIAASQAIGGRQLTPEEYSRTSTFGVSGGGYGPTFAR